ncbi:hypothetical protein Q1695_014978 [Nippostrongylus brasiliensis]|nr:hypothetical protein Q1695_014978 [Nippostrongylus brasiliensis]
MALRLAHARVIVRSFARALSDKHGDGIGQPSKSGAIREAGGAFAKKEAAKEYEYFLKKQNEQLQQLKAQLEKDIKYHEEQLRNQQKVLETCQKRMKEIQEAEKKNESTGQK